MTPGEAEDTQPLLEVRGLQKHFPLRDGLGRLKAQVRAVEDVSFRIYPGETYGLVGESGCGKSTTGRTILRLTDPTGGRILFEGQDITTLSQAALKPLRRRMQMVFQDPYSALNPRRPIGDTLSEALAIHGIGTRAERNEAVLNLLARVGLQRDHYYRLPHEFSGGQRQRIGLARALILNPALIVCDESVSALDVSVQAQIINLLRSIQRSDGLSYLFIAHDMSVVRHISDRVGVMYLGRLVEEAPTGTLFSAAAHPYTQALLAAIPVPDPRVRREKRPLQGEIPSPLNPPSGCVFHTRCPRARPLCAASVPEFRPLGPGHNVACHFPG